MDVNGVGPDAAKLCDGIVALLRRTKQVGQDGLWSFADIFQITRVTWVSCVVVT